MSAILSADDLNDFISPGVACIKPVETLPLQNPTGNDYEVTTEDQVAAQAPPAQISLTDCLACSGCVTSAEAVLVSLQSHSEVLGVLDSAPMIPLEHLRSQMHFLSKAEACIKGKEHGKIFVASISPQVRASLAATYGTTEREAGWMIEQLLSGTHGIGTGGKYGNRFAWVLDTNAMREACLVLEAEDLANSLDNSSMLKKPILSSACPGWICYAEKTHPHLIPHLSRLKSPQALTGTLLKTVLSKKLGVKPSQIWHLAVMPCFDKKLEASRAELTDTYWATLDENATLKPGASRDVDCVITAREILMVAESRSISFPSLPREAIGSTLKIPFPDSLLEDYFCSYRPNKKSISPEISQAGTSGGFLFHILSSQQALYSGSSIVAERGRNSDVVEFKIVLENKVLFKAARYYGFRNIQNLVRKLKPPRPSRLPGGKSLAPRRPNGILAAKEATIENSYIEVMACPGGCTNGGGQIKIDDLGNLQAKKIDISSQKDWLSFVDETYYSIDEGRDSRPVLAASGFSNSRVEVSRVKAVLVRWSEIVGINLHSMTHTTFRVVESDVGKPRKNQTQHVVELASKIGGGW